MGAVRQNQRNIRGKQQKSTSMSAANLTYAERVCAGKAVRLTPMRRQVLQIILGSKEPIGAYEILAQLNKLRSEHRAPVTVYRALDFLIGNGLVHRVTSLNAFIACDHPDHNESAQLLICRDCGATEEVTDRTVEAAIAKLASRRGYIKVAPLVEIAGTCATCHNQNR
ncbi:MAG: transcriptional repressor [Alphaproteobacteria bacterium]